LAADEDVIIRGIGAINGDGHVRLAGDFFNHTSNFTDFDMRPMVLAFEDPSPNGAATDPADISRLWSNSSDLYDPTSLTSYPGARLFLDSISFNIDADDDAFAMRLVDLPWITGPVPAVPTLDVFAGRIYLLNHPDNGMPELLSGLAAGTIRLWDSLNPTRPAYDPLNPSESIIQLASGLPGSPTSGFVDNFAIGELALDGADYVVLRVPEPTTAMLAGAALVLIFWSGRHRGAKSIK
jgi:hypothetical protein